MFTPVKVTFAAGVAIVMPQLDVVLFQSATPLTFHVHVWMGTGTVSEPGDEDSETGTQLVAFPSWGYFLSVIFRLYHAPWHG